MSRIFVAGHRGLVGSAIVKRLIDMGHDRTDIVTRSHALLDLTDQSAVRQFFAAEKIDEVYLAAAKVGGIVGNNTYPADFIYKNIMIQANVINAAHRNGVKKLLMLGSTCVYPKLAPQPIREEYLMTGHLESTNEPYAVAKIAGIKMCESYNRQYGTDYRSVLPCNLFGPGDNYDIENGHLAAGVIRRMHEAKVANAPTVTIWGTGTPRREFLYSEDMADGCIFVMNLDKAVYDSNVQPMQSYLNLTSGTDMEIGEFVKIVKEVVDYKGELVYDTNRPDGTMRKVTDNGKILALGWKPTTSLKTGLEKSYEWFLQNKNRWA
jgi:GDP-L-fucose synthase